LLRPQLSLYAEMRGRAHTIPLLDTFRDKRGNPVLVFPFMPDDHTPDSPSAVRSYMRQLLESLAFLHDELRVMHRNIKRANCLFSGGGQLTLIDFEGACHVTTGALYTRVGNNLYRAPEVAAAKARGSAAAAAYAYNAFDDCLSPCAPYGCLADVFSAGAIFFELLTGARRLLDGDDSLSVQYAALEDALSAEQAKLDADDAAFDPRTPFAQRAMAAGGPPALARLTWDAADLLRRMLAGSPAVRCSAAEALEHPYFTRPDADASDDRAFFAAVARERERDHRSGASRAPHPAPRTRRPRRDDDADGAARN
jgi:serine/threonine protein kinase